MSGPQDPQRSSTIGSMRKRLTRPTCDDPWMAFATLRRVQKQRVARRWVRLPRFRLQRFWLPGSRCGLTSAVSLWERVEDVATLAVDNMIDRNGDLNSRPFQTETWTKAIDELSSDRHPDSAFFG